jgi:hypothetical protein
MHAVTYQGIAMAIKMATFLGVFVDCCLFACCPGRRWGDTEQVVAQWQLLRASSVALDSLHRVMPRSLLQRVCCGHQNGLRRRHIRSSSLILSLTITVAKQHSNT